MIVFPLLELFFIDLLGGSFDTVSRDDFLLILTNNNLPSDNLSSDKLIWRAFVPSCILLRMTSKRPPKRRNAEKTKSNLLKAAQKSFSEQGYPVTGIREIAAIADVSSTMLLNYYGSKAGLFEAALIDAIGPNALSQLSRQGFGEFIANLFVHSEQVATVPSMIVLASADPEARDISMRVTKEQVLSHLAEWLGPPDAMVRAVQIHLLSIGFIFYTKNLPVLSGSKSAEKKLAKWFAKSIQDIVDQS